MKKSRSLLLVFMTALVSGVSIYLNKYAVKGMDSTIFTFSKNITVSLFLFSTILLFSNYGEIKKLTFYEWKKLIAIGLVGGSIPFILFFKGLSMTTGTAGSLIHKTMFLYVLVLAPIFLKEKLNKFVLLGSALLLFGNYMMLKPQLVLNQGNMMILAATLFWALENTLSKYTLKELSGNVVAFGRMFFGSLFILTYIIMAGKAPLLTQLTMPQLSWIAVTSSLLFLYVITWYNGLKHVPVTLATSILLLGAPITTLLKFITGAQMTLNTTVGMLSILIGVITFIHSTEYYKLSDIKEFIFSFTKKWEA